MKLATIYIPVSRSVADQIIAPGSGIVAFDNDASDFVIAYYEGNLLGACNMVNYEDRIKNAAGRMFTRYPTTALHGFLRGDLPFNLIPVGTIDENYNIEWIDRDKAMEYAYGETTFSRRQKAGMPRLAVLA